MYHSFFKLREDPFDNCPDPRFFYNSPAHEEALASVHHVVAHRKGAILLTGPSGIGKTLIGRLAVRSLGSEVRQVWLRNPLLSAKELLVEICRGLRLEVDSDASQVDLMSVLERYLKSQFGNDTVVCIVVDDVQDFSPEAYRLLKTLNNMEVDDAKLVQLVLLGRSQARGRAVARLREELQERLYRVLELPPLTPEQTSAYLSHRLKLAGDKGELSFTAEAVAKIYRVSGGIPRAINQIAEFALLAAYAESARLIGTETLNRALEENSLPEPRSPEPPGPDHPEPGESASPAATAPASQEGQHINGLRLANTQAEDLLGSSRAALDEMSAACARTLAAAQDPADDVQNRLGKLQQQIDKASAKAEARLAGVFDQLCYAADRTLEQAGRRLAARQDQMLAATDQALAQAEARLAGAQEQARTTASTVESHLEEVRTRFIEAVNQTAEQVDCRLSERRRQLLESAERTAAEAETHLTHAREEFAAQASAAETRLRQTGEELADAAGETLANVQQTLAQARRETAEQQAEATRRLLRQLDDACERNLLTHRDAQQAHAELAEQTSRAAEALRQLDQNLPRLEQAHQRVEDLLVRVDRKLDDLQETYRQGDTSLKKGLQLLADFRTWKQELVRDRARTAKVLKRTRQQLAIVADAETRACNIARTADQKAGELKTTMIRVDQLLTETGQKLIRMTDVHHKTEKLMARGLDQLAENQHQAEAIILSLEKQQAVARAALEKLERSTGAAQKFSKMQIRLHSGFRRKTRRLVANLYAQKQDAEKALETLRRLTRQAEEALAQPQALVEEALQRVPQLQKLCKLLHEIYFKLNTHVPNMITPEEWGRMTDTAEGTTRQLLIANTARIRQLVDVARRLFEKTAERMAHLQSENERASTLCRMLPRRVEQSVLFMSEPGPLGQRLDHAARGIRSTAEAVGTSAPHRAAQASVGVGRPKQTVQPRAVQAGQAKIADLATRVAGLAEMLQSAAPRPRPKAGSPPAEPNTTDTALAQTASNP